MKADLLRYKHYLLLLLALLLANYLLVPLTELQNDQQLTLSLLQKKQHKSNAMLSGEGISFQEQELLLNYLKKSHDYLFVQENEADFKLAVQTQVEVLLTSSGCNISRIGFKGSEKVLPNVLKWHMEIRYKGDVDCLIKTTRALETVKPYINIEEYSYGSKSFDKTAEGLFDATLNVSVWYKANVKNYPNSGEEKS